MVRVRSPKTLQPDQMAAVDPFIHASLSASAGTGKTQVLTARVLRLLLEGAAPETILCLTFTKAAAAEMAERIGHQLAAWVRLGDDQLAAALAAIGAPTGPETRREARALFARVLDCPGGLRIQTIHSFCQTLLATFPAEAGTSPGFRPIEGREEQALIDRTLAVLAEQSAAGDGAFLSDLEALAGRMGESGVRDYLKLCASSEGLQSLPPEAIEIWLRREVGLPEGDVEAAILAECRDDSMDCELLRRLATGYRGWKSSKTAPENAALIEAFLEASPAERCRLLPEIARLVLKQDGSPRQVTSGFIKALPSASEDCEALAERFARLLQWRRTDQLVRLQAAGLRAGRSFAIAYAAAKRAAGVADFDDLIRWTRDLLAQPGIGEWVRFKLDRRTDHLLVDEAQDTNEAQWRIVTSLVEEFFAGAGQGSDHRTLFIVGDFKQAIYGFQGTDPREFERARGQFEELAGGGETPFRNLSISASFRSSQVVLDLVDEVIESLGPEALGLASAPPRHRAFHSQRPGLVELWPPFERTAAAEEDGDLGEEEWEDEDKRAYADHLASSIAALVEEAPLLASTGKPLTPGDILVLVRSRRSGLAALLVARLAERQIPTAGLDRMTLSQPLAVKDLLAAMTFAVQPLDDLNLASLLVSPLLGWSQDDLYELAHREGRRPLWEELGRRQNERELFGATREALGSLLASADFEGPHAFLERLLSGPLRGRLRLLERLGRDKRDPVNELLSAALAFEAQESGGLQRFLHWFASGEVEVKRDPEARHNAVRVMTVHGAKGLEAPVVILADATADPDKAGAKSPPLLWPGAQGVIPLLRPRSEELCPPFDALVDEDKRRAREEHHRLGYVALTRAAERLIVAGLKGKKVAAASWHAVVQEAMERLGAELLPDGRLRLVGLGEERAALGRRRLVLARPVLPSWANRPAPQEARPPRPLAPSQLAPDIDSRPPPTPALRAAAERGRLLHALFERLPDTRPEERREQALRWLEQSAGVAAFEKRAALVDLVLPIIEAPEHAELFGLQALAEAPIAATLPDGRVVAGTVDRLLVTSERVRVIDFKTGRSVPGGPADVPESHLRQMQAYGAALQVIFPGRQVELGLLYTEGPKLVSIALEEPGQPTHMRAAENQELISP
jgi:ATP-dependent helicase/nuclease subunit A